MTLRRRLTLVLALAVGLSGIALAAGSYFLVRHNLLSDSVDSSIVQTRRNLVVAAAYPDTGALVDAYKSRGDFLTVATRGGRTYLSSTRASLRSVPPDLRALVDRGQLGYQRATVGGDRFLVTGALPRTGRSSTSSSRRTTCGTSSRCCATSCSAPSGSSSCSRRWPVSCWRAAPCARSRGRARRAHSLAEGLLETRLPVEGRDEFGAWAQSFNEMAAALEAKIEALSAAQARERRFTADVGARAADPADRARWARPRCWPTTSTSMPPESRRPAELLIADVGRLRRLVEDLMEISRFDAGAESVHAEEVDVAALVRAAVRARGWEGRVRIEGDGLRVTSDPRRLERIVANLVDNALEHGGSSVSVRVGEGEIEVADDGPGISPEHLPHVFERFYKADASRSGGGTGLGLAIARENAILLGSELAVASEPGQGTRFTLRL